MVGCGSPAIERQCRHIAEKHLPKEAVEFAGETYPTDKVVANSDVCVLTTDHETCPLVLLEAMRAGKPVIASAVTGIPEQVQSGYNGFLISSSLELRQALYRLLEEPDLRQDMGAKGRKMFEAMFCDRQAVPKIRDLFDRLL
jgi:glycosyltransferase involved in cell wall biosynthesis